MDNKPNMYRVNYLVMEGNNYAGGWGKRTADIKELGDAERFSNIESIVPMFIEMGDPVPSDVIYRAIDARKQENEHKRLKAIIETAEKHLAMCKELSGRM